MATQQDVDKLSRAIGREIPVAELGSFLRRYQNAATGDGCGDGCGGGCCGAGCKTATGTAFDQFGHTEFSAGVLNDIGQNRLGDLRAAVKNYGLDQSNSIPE